MAARRRLVGGVLIAALAIGAAFVGVRARRAAVAPPPETTEEERETEEAESTSTSEAEPETADDASETPAPAPEDERKAALDAGAPPDAEAPKRPPKPRARLLHTLDPCAPWREPEIPHDFAQQTDAGVTLAWPAEVNYLEPTVLSYLVAGLLEEAASITGTARRPTLTVVVYPSREALHASGGAPKWASGFYDGVVKLPADPNSALGIRLGSLRHEVMHAQLHAGVGCTPVWFNEGAASYFAGSVPRDEWMRMLRRRQLLGFSSLQVEVVEEVRAESVAQVYAQSLAMVLFAVERASEPSLKEATLELRRLNLTQDGLLLWSRLFPSVSEQGVLDALARRIFEVPTGPELDRIFSGAVCCTGRERLRDFTCYGAPAVPGKDLWVDESRSTLAVCRTN